MGCFCKKSLLFIVCCLLCVGCNSSHVKYLNNKINLDGYEVSDVFLKEAEIKKGIESAAKWINETYDNKEFIMVSILDGSSLFTGQLFPFLEVDGILDFIKIQKQNNGVKPKLVLDLSLDVKGKEVLIISDMVNTGTTLNLIKDFIKERGASNIKTMVFIDKTQKHKTDFKIDYTCFESDKSLSLIGFGLDYNNKGCNLPNIYIVDQKK